MSQECEIVYNNGMPEKNLLYRFVNNGLDLKVVEDALLLVKSKREWLPVWVEVGDMYRKLGDEAIRDGHMASAGEYFIKASLGYHFAQFFHFFNIEEKLKVQRTKIEVHKRAWELVNPPIRRIEANFEGVTIPINVRTPSGHGPYPTVFFVCGMDSTKEEYYFFENYLLSRGIAVVAFDGPGQGEVWQYMKMRPDFHKAVSAVADIICKMKEIDENRLFILGLSLGGLLGPLAVSHDQRFKSCIGNGGFFDLTYFDWENPIRAIGMPFLIGAKSKEEAKEMSKEYTLAKSIQNIRVPILIIHGGLDKDAPPHAAKRIVDEAPGGGRFALFPDGIHMCHNIGYKVKPLITDWLLDQAKRVSD